MEIFFRNKNIQKECENSKVTIKLHGLKNAEVIQKRMFELANAKSLQDIILLKAPGLHWLSGKRQHQCAVKILDGKRIVFEPKNNESNAFCDIEIIEIQEIINYHP